MVLSLLYHWEGACAADMLAQAKTGGPGFVLLIVQPREINVL